MSSTYIDKAIDKSIDDSKQIPELKKRIQVFSLENFFSKEDYVKISSDVTKYKYLTNPEAPPEGEEPSIITFDKIQENDLFYKKMWKYFGSDQMKIKVLKKFGYTKNINMILKCTRQTIAFHTEYSHQIDNQHSDQKFTLSTFTLQIYLPIDNSLKDYGTSFVGDNSKIICTTNFLPNTGYIMESNNNAWHKPTLGVERKSLIVRYIIEIDYAKVGRVFNFNKNSKTCYIVWNKKMDVHIKVTDWMAHMTLINMIEQGFENIVATMNPFKNKLDQLKKLKDQGFTKAVIFFGGYVWKTNEMIKYAEALNMKEIIAGIPHDNTYFARQCFILNLNRLDEIQESDSKDKFFARYINDSIDISSIVAPNRKYYHPDSDSSATLEYLQTDIRAERLNKKCPGLLKQIKYFDQYKRNYSTLEPLTYSISP